MESLKRRNSNGITSESKRIKENSMEKVKYRLRYSIQQLIDIGNKKKIDK
jgi:hypothetical protein